MLGVKAADLLAFGARYLSGTLVQEEQPRGGPERDDGRTVDWPTFPSGRLAAAARSAFCPEGVLEGCFLAKDTIDASPKTVVAALNGPALGGGCEVSSTLFRCAFESFASCQALGHRKKRKEGRSLANKRRAR